MATQAIRNKLRDVPYMALIALGISVVSFYRSYFYKSQKLDVQVTDVSYVTNEGGLYMTIAFSNGGNRDAAILRVEPTLWGRKDKAKEYEWIPIDRQIDKNIPIAAPAVPAVVKAGGVELIKLSALLNPVDAEQARFTSLGAVFLGIHVATMNSDGNLYSLHHPVAKLVIDKQGRIQNAEPTINKSLSGFVDVEGVPPGDVEQKNKKTPFVWADEHS